MFNKNAMVKYVIGFAVGISFIKAPVVHAQGNLDRLYGQDRYGTSVSIANYYSSGQLDNVVIASGNGFADALAGSGLSKSLNAPMLLVDKSINSSLAPLDYIKNHLKKDGNIYILGGTSSVSDEFIEYLKKQGFTNIFRMGGQDRYDTNKIIINSMNISKGTPIVVVNGENFADALSISSIAANKGYPILLTESKKLPKSAEDKISELKPSKVYVIGGNGVVSDEVMSRIKTAASLDDTNLIRIYGDDRYKTSMSICKYFDEDPSNVVFANGELFPDALSGSALAAKLNAPIILTNGTNIEEGKKYLNSNKIKKGIILGGVGVVSKDVEEDLNYNLDVNNSNLSYSNSDSEFVSSEYGTSSGDWLYVGQYDLPMETGLRGIYKIKKDGSEKIKLCDDTTSSLNIVGDWIYYIKKADSPSADNTDLGLYKIKTDGTNRTKLKENVSGDIRVAQDYIYFSDVDSEAKLPSITGIYRIKTDGTELTKLISGSAFDFTIDGNYIYYSIPGKTWTLNRSNLDGSNVLTLSKFLLPKEKESNSYDCAIDLSVTDGWVYYKVLFDSNLYRVRFNGKDKEKVGVAEHYFIKDGYIYFTKNISGLFRMDTDGSNEIKIDNSIDIYKLRIHNNQYYIGDSNIPVGNQE